MGVTIRQKVPGKGNPWCVFVAHNNNRTSRMVGDKKAADDVASKIRAKLQLGEFAFDEKAPEPTFKEYADAWITRTVPAGCKQSTIRGYEDLLRIHVHHVFGGLRLSEITKGKIKDFLASKVIDGFSTSSVMHMKNVISGVLNQAVDAEAIQSNLSLGIGKGIVQKATNGEAENGNGN